MTRKSPFGRSNRSSRKQNSARLQDGTRRCFEPLEQRRVLAAYINEIYFDPPGSGGDLIDEYIELRGTPSMALDDYYLIFLENENNSLNTGNPGMVERIFDLSGESFGSNGFLTLRQKGNPYTVDPDSTDLVNSGTGQGWGSGISSSLNTVAENDEVKIENSGFTAMLIYNSGGATYKPVIGQDLDQGNDGLDPAGSDDNDWNDYWTIIDSIGIHSELGEAQYGRLYAAINFGPEGPTNIEPGATYIATGFEIEYLARWANSTGQTEDDWDVSNLSDDPILGYTGTGDFRQSTGDPKPTGPLESSHGVPAGTNLTGSLGSINYPFTSPSTIAGTGHEGRYIFYNHSKFDGNSDTNNASDDAAIPPSKTAYLPGDGQMVLANITNFTKGLNGIMVDLTAGSADHTLINASDFVFKVGANNSPDLWATLTATPTISVRTGAGISGSDRVDITWNNNAIQDQYLEVQVLATAHTGMDANFGTISGNAVGDVFFFGNLIGETNSVTPGGAFARSLSADGNPIVAAGVLTSVGIDSFLDVDRSNSVTFSGDRNPIVVGGVGTLIRISVGTAGPFAPEGGGGGGDAGISSGLAATSTSSSSSSSTLALPASVATRLDSAGSTVGVVSTYSQLLDDAGAAAADDADDAGVDDETLDSIVEGLRAG